MEQILNITALRPPEEVAQLTLLLDELPGIEHELRIVKWGKRKQPCAVFYWRETEGPQIGERDYVFIDYAPEILSSPVGMDRLRSDLKAVMANLRKS